MTDGTTPPAGQGDAKPVRPGDSVPEGGLDPTQVFSSPPPPPPPQTSPAAGSAVAAGAQPAGTQPPPPPQDQGPPPPPPGQQATKEQGYDDEDIRILGEVGDYRFGSIAAQLSNDKIGAPAHPETQFDEQGFLTLLRGSISLTRDEKWRIIQAIPKLSQFQIDELQKILQEERKKFSELSPKHLLQLMKLEQKHAEDWKDLQTVTVQQDAQKQEAEQADEIRKQLGL
ncbi:hypothetical protein COU76_02345 [Candidatus Peregrinibacteria bacterium CG10_big_fil_rev_8_21_14_0_10_49_10]|nr:MAG: hypothetical protein COU76_02345 [Candidatus Peregrinibacteria bacterium CG10_big_fil_rev_8_21_14_0_10_49_10]